MVSMPKNTPINKQKKVTLQVLLTVVDAGKVRRLAERHGISVSDLLRSLVKKRLEESK